MSDPDQPEPAADATGDTAPTAAPTAPAAAVTEAGPKAVTEPGSGRWLLPRDLALIALFAALIAVLGLPGGFALFGAAVPITAQSLGVMLAGSVLGARRGMLAVVTLLVLVAAGLPLLAGGRGGIGVFAGPTAGYLVGWILGAGATGWLVTVLTRRRRLPWLIVANILGGIVVVYALGIPVTAWRVHSGFIATVISAVQYLPGDAIKVVISAAITLGVYRAYPVPDAGKRSGE